MPDSAQTHDLDTDLAAAGVLALSTLTSILKDPDASIPDKRLAAGLILRHIAATRPREPRGRPRATGSSAPRTSESPVDPLTPVPAASTRARTPDPSDHCAHEADPAPPPPLPPALRNHMRSLKQNERTLSAISHILRAAGSPVPPRARAETTPPPLVPALLGPPG